MRVVYLVQGMAQDKHIKKHQEFLEKMREEVREDKDKILEEIDVDLVMNSPREQLLKIAEKYYGSKNKTIEESIKSGKKLANSILKGIKK